MNSVRVVAVLLLVFGFLAFVVPIPHREDHSLKIGDAKIGVETNHSLHPVGCLDALPREVTQLAIRHVDGIVDRDVVGREQSSPSAIFDSNL